MIAALVIKLNENVRATIYLVGTYNKIDWKKDQHCVLGEDYFVYPYKDDIQNIDSIKIEKGLDGGYIIRLVETKRYIIKLEGKHEEDKEKKWNIRIQNEENKCLNIERDKESLIFQFVNYLGRSKIMLSNKNETQSITFEVVPDKMNYEDDYIELTEGLAQRCAEILLDYSGTTSNLYSLSDSNPKTLLEQFIFLRQFCYSENIQGLFESIKRNPDSILVQNEEFKPIGTGIPSRKIYSNPILYAKNWNKYVTDDGTTRYMPQEIAVTQKRDNKDTSANRFIKFALEKFDYICLELIESLINDGAAKQTECLMEAKAIHEMLDTISKDHFFDEVGVLDIMPQNNQVLQKREAYSQIFSAYFMIDMALQLDWKGENLAFEGESKNVALLYEYWLFFELFKIITSIDGCKTVETDDNPFIKSDKGGLVISLKEGKQSCQSFCIPQLKTKINLYYNRTFSNTTEFVATKYEGSYSRPFRPDYTIAIFPDYNGAENKNDESEAIKKGDVSYIHFDAKYRITDLTSLIGKVDETLDEGESEINDDKAYSVINTYKRGDLLKMHTYNDAIRRTVGSYVLYPGSNQDEHREEIFSRFDEILPGVGAFAIKPSNNKQSENILRKFITDVIEEKVQYSSRLNRLIYYSEMVLHEPKMPKKDKEVIISVESHDNEVFGKKCVLGYIRNSSDDDYYNSLIKTGKLKKGNKFLFYYYAIRNGYVYTHHRDIAGSTFFRFYTNDIQETGTYQVQPVLCKIDKYELVSKEKLIAKLKKQGYKTTMNDHNGDFYYVLEVCVIDDNCECLELKTMEVNAENGNDSFSPHSPKIIYQKG